MSKEVVFEVHCEDIKQHIDVRLDTWRGLRKDVAFIEAFERMNEKLPHKIDLDSVGFRLSIHTEMYIFDNEYKYSEKVTNDDYGIRFKKRTQCYKATEEVVAMVREYFKEFQPHLLTYLFGLGIVKRIHRTKSDKRYFVICNTESQYGDKLVVPNGVSEIKMSEYYQIVGDDEK